MKRVPLRPSVDLTGCLLTRPPAKGGDFRLRVDRTQKTADGWVEGYDDLTIYAPPMLASKLHARGANTRVALRVAATPKGVRLRSLA